MRLAKKSRTLLPLAFSAVLATCALAQDHPNIQPSAVRDMLSKQASVGSSSQGGAQMPPASPSKMPGPAAAKPRAKVPAPSPKPAPGNESAKGAVDVSAKNGADGKG